MYNIVTNKKMNLIFRTSNYFKTDLGRALTVREKDDRKLFDVKGMGDFVSYYYNKLKIIVYKEGSIGKLTFYTNHYLKDDDIIVSDMMNDYNFKFDKLQYNTNGINDYIGFLIKEIETKYKKEKESEIILDEPEIIADPMKLFSNPGSVNYEDIIAYQKNKKLLKK